MWGGLFKLARRSWSPSPGCLPALDSGNSASSFLFLRNALWSVHTSFTTAERSQIKLLRVFALEIPQGDATLEKVLTML